MYEFTPGSTGRSVNIALRDSTSAQGKTGLAFNSPGASVSYTRFQQTPVAVPLVALADPAAAWVAGGFVKNSDALAPGECRFDVPNAALAPGVPWVTFFFRFTGAFDQPLIVFLREGASNLGAGSEAYTITVQKPDLTPIPGAAVWITTDIDGANTIAGTAYTDAMGKVTFMLDPGSYFQWVQCEGYNGPNPTAFTVADL